MIFQPSSVKSLGVCESTQQKINQYWDSRAAAYQQYQTEGTRAALEKQVWQALFKHTLTSNSFIADMGTGTGYLANTLAQLGHRVVGVDASLGMLNHAPTHHAISFVAGNVHRPPLGSYQFDVITSRYLLWTLQDPVAALQEWRKLLKSDGRIFAIDALWFPDGDNINPIVDSTAGPTAFSQAYSPATLDTLPLALTNTLETYLDAFHQAGFRDIQYRYLEEIAELDATFGVSKGHVPRPQFIISAGC